MQSYGVPRSRRGPSFVSLSSRKLSEVARRMGSMLRAGLPVERTLRVVGDSERSHAVSRALRGMVDRIHAGETLSQAMRAYSPLFPPLFVEMIEVGEVSGALDEVFRFLAEHYEWRGRIRRQTVISLIWPSVEFVAACLVLGAVFWIISEINGGGFPFVAGVFLALPFVIALGGYLGYSFSGVIVSSETASRTLLSIPVVGRVFKSMALAKLGFALKVSLNAALPIRDCLEKAARASDNSAVAGEVDRVISAVESGETLHEAFARTSFIPHDLLATIEVGEVSGELGALVGRMAEYYAEDAQASLKALCIGMVWAIRLAVICFVAYFVLRLAFGYMSLLDSLME
jgi:type II secretory pathway component PulF